MVNTSGMRMRHATTKCGTRQLLDGPDEQCAATTNDRDNHGSGYCLHCANNIAACQRYDCEQLARHKCRLSFSKPV